MQRLDSETNLQAFTYTFSFGWVTLSSLVVAHDRQSEVAMMLDSGMPSEREEVGISGYHERSC